MIVLLICLATCLYLIYKKFTSYYDFFNGLGIKFNKPSIFFDLFSRILFSRLPMKDRTRNNYNKFSQEKVYGVFRFYSPAFCVRDLDLIKQMFIKNNDHFSARRDDPGPEENPIIALNLSGIRGEEHRDMRATLSPLLTTGKIKQMFESISDCAEEMIHHLISQNELKKSHTYVVNVRELYNSYFVNAIASCFFNIKINSFKNPNNEFNEHIRKVSYMPMVARFIKSVIPCLNKFMNWLYVGDHNYIHSFIFDTIKDRMKENINRPDMINLIMELRNGTLKYDNKIDAKSIEGFSTATEYSTSIKVKRNWSDDHLMAQCLLFIVSGADSTAAMLGFAATELALHQDVQDKLYQEIIDTDYQLKGSPINYEKMLSMKYMDMVVSEVLRKWPVIDNVDRCCTKDFLLETDDLPKILIKKGTNALIPIMGIHYDPKYFPNPEKFDPERFSNDQIHNIISGSYMPFGLGPRNCPASRLSLILMKRALFSVLKEFSFEICPGTNLPLTSGVNQMFPEKDILLGFRKRVKS